MEMLKDDEGHWVEDVEKLKEMAVEYFGKLFRSETRESGSFISGAFPLIDEGLMEMLEAEVTVEETMRALNRMGSYKIPGPDGYQPIFFKSSWSITGVAVFSFVRDVLRGSFQKHYWSSS